jgi:hypothetical protein
MTFTDQTVTLYSPDFEGEEVVVTGRYRAIGAYENEYLVRRADGSTMAVRGTSMAEQSWTVVERDGKLYTVPETGRHENLNSMLTEVPDDAHAMAFLMQDGNLAVPGGRYGIDTRSCAPVTLALAKIMAEHSGESITYYQLDSDMGLVVNSHDDVAYTIREYGEMVGVDPAELLGDEDLQPSPDHD